MKKIFKTFTKLNFYIMASSLIWLPIVIYRFGIVFSDNVLRKLIEKK